MYRKLSSIALCLYVYLCGTPPPDLNLSLTWPTAQGRYMSDLLPLAEPVLVNRMHSWEVRVTSPTPPKWQAEPLRGAVQATRPSA